MEGKGTATVRVQGLGYIAEYFRLDGHDVVHAAVPHVDPQVRAVAPVWLPHIPPAPLCGLGRGLSQRTPVLRSSGELCRACTEHLRDLDEWVRQAEHQLRATAATSNGNGDQNGQNGSSASRVHDMPF